MLFNLVFLFLVFVLIFCYKVSLQMSPLRLGSSSPTVLWFSWMYHCCFSKPGVKGLISPAWDLRVGMPDVGHKFITFRKKFCIFELPPNCGLLTWGGIFLARLCLCLYYHLNAPLLSFVVEALFIKFSGLFRGNYSICGCRFVTSMVGGEFRISLNHHLKPLFKTY